jgi:hypothetical protein
VDKAGEGSVIATVRASYADDSFDRSGEKYNAPTFRKEDVDLYVTYGVSDETTLIGQARYVRLHPDNPSIGTRGWDETLIGVQQHVWNDDTRVFSAQFSALLAGDSTLSSGGTDWEARGLYGQSFELFDRQAYVDIELAYRWRANDFANQVKPEATIGVWAREDVLVMAQYFGTITTTDGAEHYFEGGQHKGQLSGMVRLSENLGLQFGAFATLDGRDTPAERGMFAALWFDY